MKRDLEGVVEERILKANDRGEWRQLVEKVEQDK